MPVRLGIYIPAFNAAHTLPGVIERLPASAWALCDDVVIVDDGSADRTAAVIDELASCHPAIRRISLSHNQGYGAAVRTGLTALTDSPADYFACLHADGQYPRDARNVRAPCGEGATRYSARFATSGRYRTRRRHATV